MTMIPILENEAAIPEGFLWGLAVATIGWLSLSVVSALVLGLMIRRSNVVEDLDDEQQDPIVPILNTNADPNDTEIRAKESSRLHVGRRALK